MDKYVPHRAAVETAYKIGKYLACNKYSTNGGYIELTFRILEKMSSSEKNMYFINNNSWYI